MLFKKKTIELGNRDLGEGNRIEAHLENLRGANTVLYLQEDPGGLSFKVGGIDRAADSVSLIALQGLADWRENDIITFFYSHNHERYRFGQRLTSIDRQKGILNIFFPLVIRANDRRISSRYNFPAREAIHTSLLTDLSAGIGISGTMHNLGGGGGALSVEKIVSLSTEKDLRISKELIKPGPLTLIHFKLPTGQLFEVSGRLIHALDEGRIRVGFAFDERLPETGKKALQFFLDSKGK